MAQPMTRAEALAERERLNKLLAELPVVDEPEDPYEYETFDLPVHEHEVIHGVHEMQEHVDESSRAERARRVDADGNPAPLPPRIVTRAVKVGEEKHTRKRVTLPLPKALTDAGWEHQIAEPEHMAFITDAATIPLQLRRKKPTK